jgi:DNA polymerase-4
MRKIIHIDMDCFYAAIEMRDAPELRGKPVAVGGSPDQRGVLCTCSYEARSYGIHSAMPTAHAMRLCPDLVVLPVEMAKYKQASRKIQQIFRRYTPLIEPLSLDEAYLDVTDSPHFKGSATLIAHDIRMSIYRTQGITASAGIASNKFLAKIASDWKKPNGQFVILPEEVDDFLEELPVKKIFGVGKVTAEKLHEQNIHTCGDLRKYSVIELAERFGNFGEHLYQLARGIDDRPVQTERKRKSLSVEETFNQDLASAEACLAHFADLYEELIRRMAKDEDGPGEIKSAFVKIKFNDFTVTTIQCAASSLNEKLFRGLFTKRFAEETMPVRLLGLGVHFKEEDEEAARQMRLKLP